MVRQAGPKSILECKLLILNRITALPRFAGPFQNLSNHFKIEIAERSVQRASTRIVSLSEDPSAVLIPSLLLAYALAFSIAANRSESGGR